MLRGYKVELDPTVQQRKLLEQHCHAACFLFNWTLEQWQKRYEASKTCSKCIAAKVKRASKQKLEASDYCLEHVCDAYETWGWMKTANDAGAFPSWITDIGSLIRRDACATVGVAYANAFRRIKEGKRGKKIGWPRFKKRSNKMGFVQMQPGVVVEHDHFKLPLGLALQKRIGKEKSAKLSHIRFKRKGYVPISASGAKICGFAVSKHDGHWFASFTVDDSQSDALLRTQGQTIGIDVGMRKLAVSSDERIYGHKSELHPLVAVERRLKLEQRRSSKRHKRNTASHKQSKGWHKAQAKARRINRKLTNKRKDLLHKTSNRLLKNNVACICIEGLNVAGMKQGLSRTFRRALNDVGLGELLSQLSYKAQRRGVEVVTADRWFASSQTCNACGHKDGANRRGELFECTACGHKDDADLNAAKNLRDYALREIAAQRTGPGQGLGKRDAKASRQTSSVTRKPHKAGRRSKSASSSFSQLAAEPGTMSNRGGKTNQRETVGERSKQGSDAKHARLTGSEGLPPHAETIIKEPSTSVETMQPPVKAMRIDEPDPTTPCKVHRKWLKS